MDFRLHHNLIKKIFAEYETLPNELYIEKLKEKVEILATLSHSLHVDNIQMPAWKTYIETFVVKICFHTSSLLTLIKGSELPFQLSQEKTIIFDEPSILTLLRTITENYLTFYYLFVSKITEDEKHFRFCVFEYCGIKQRQSFFTSNPEHTTKKQQEAVYLENLKKQIEKFSYFKELEKGKKKKILDGVQPRLKPWKELFKEAELRLGLDSNLYSFKSSYTHSEFLSLLQIKSSNYGYKPLLRKNYYVLFIVHMLICRLIMNICDLFPSIKRHFEELDSEIKIEIEFLSVNLAIDSETLRK